MEDFVLLCQKFAALESGFSELRPLVRPGERFDEKDIFNVIRIRMTKTILALEEVLERCGSPGLECDLNIRADSQLLTRDLLFAE